MNNELNFDPTKQLPKDKAIKEAIKMQDLLYAWPSQLLRSKASFQPENYENAAIVKQVIDQIIEILSQLPEDENTRAQIFANLEKNVPQELVLKAWQEILLRDVSKTEGYEHFVENADGIFGEVEKEFKPLSYKLKRGSEYDFSTPSDYMMLAYKLYCKISNKPFKNAEELRENYKEAVSGKKVLELGPGPGWFLKTLKSLGADVAGIDLNAQSHILVGNSDLNIKEGSAADIEKVFPENFDIVLSHDFFPRTIIPNSEAIKTVIAINNRLKSNGFSIHSLVYVQMPKELLFLQFDQGTTPEKARRLKQLFEESPPEKQKELLQSNKPSLSLNDLERLGLKDPEYEIESAQLIFSFSK
jgi:SAM-dependent methyltransferase